MVCFDLPGANWSNLGPRCSLYSIQRAAAGESRLSGSLIGKKLAWRDSASSVDEYTRRTAWAQYYAVSTLAEYEICQVKAFLGSTIGDQVNRTPEVLPIMAQSPPGYLSPELFAGHPAVRVGVIFNC